MTRTNALLSALLRVHSERTMLIVLGALTAALLILAYMTLVMPNASYVKIFLNDVIGLTDAAYRTFRGQIPSLDFFSLYGAAIYYPAALGFYFDFNPGAVLGFGHFVTAVPLLVMAVLASYRRLPILHSIILVLFLFLLIVVPMRPGGISADLTYGIYYTRHGWAALTIALLFYLEPRSLCRSDLFVDSIILALLLLYLFYTKLNFAIVALVFVFINGMTSKYKMRLSIISLSSFASVIAAVFIFTEYNTAYFNDILSVANRVPAVQSEFRTLFWMIITEHLDIFLLCFAALAAVYLTGHRNFFDLAFVTCCIIASVMILDQSGGTSRGLPALIVVFLICGELARRAECRIEEGTAPSSWPRNVASIAILGMLLAFASEQMTRGTHALRYFYNMTTGEHSLAVMNLSGIFVPSALAFDAHEALGHDDAAHAIFNQLRGSSELSAREYLPLIAEGAELLASVPHDNHSVINFEHSNPFSMLLGMRPTEYGYPLFWSYRNLPAAERYFSDAHYVMVPEIPYSRSLLKSLMEHYSAYLQENFYELKRSTHWRLYARS